MPSDPVLDLEALLAPIAGDNPAGQSLFATTILADLREYRRSEDVGNLGEWAPAEAKTANWNKLDKVAIDTLTNKSKDIRVAGHLMESKVVQKGFPGLRDGLRLIREIQERYWDLFYPALTAPEGEEDEYEDDNPIEVRAAALGQIDRLMVMPVRSIPSTKPQGGGNVYSQVDWDQANYVDNLKGKQQEAYDQAISEGQPTGELFARAVSLTPVSFYQKYVEDLDECHEELRLLNELIEQRYQDTEQLPILSGVRGAIEGIERMVRDIEKIHGKLRKSDEVEEEQTGEAEGEDVGVARKAAFTGEGIPLEPVDRADAMRRLQAVAAYFRKAEPHSPIAFLIDRAIHWGNLSLDQWLMEVVKDQAVLGAVRETLGLNPDTGESV
ncbi:MAG: type VI secretion system protein TssA [Bryobacterales bacterium]|nr:type VI secretion system protein TssA [Bryobacterales bacterium]